MRTLRLVVLLTIALGLLIPSVVMAKADDSGKEVKTVKELIAMYDSTRCKQCHEQIYKDWEKSLHSKPLIGPFSKTLGTLIDYLKQRDGELKKSSEITKSIKDYMMPC
ncbi:Cytochrome c552, partial [Candidatus Magnetobacterium bavaricum]